MAFITFSTIIFARITANLTLWIEARITSGIIQEITGIAGLALGIE